MFSVRKNFVFWLTEGGMPRCAPPLATPLSGVVQQKLLTFLINSLKNQKSGFLSKKEPLIVHKKLVSKKRSFQQSENKGSVRKQSTHIWDRTFEFHYWWCFVLIYFYQCRSWCLRWNYYIYIFLFRKALYEKIHSLVIPITVINALISQALKKESAHLLIHLNPDLVNREPLNNKKLA